MSPYDGATWTASGDVDIDHMVPLENAWVVSDSSGVFLLLLSRAMNRVIVLKTV